jgi:hypothetical protein
MVVADHAQGRPRAGLRRLLQHWWVPLALYALTFAALVVLAANRLLAGTLVASGVLLAVALWWNGHLRRNLPANRQEEIARVAVPLVMVLFGVAAILWTVRGNPGDGWGFAGVCTLFLGIGQLLTLWRSLRHPPRWWGVPISVWLGLAILVLCGLAFTAGVLMLSEESSKWAVGLVVGGVLFVPLGLSLVSGYPLAQLAPRLKERPDHPEAAAARWWHALLALGAVALVGGILWLVPITDVDVKYLLVLGAVLLLLIAAIASNAPTDVLIVVAVLALLWSTAPSGVPTDDQMFELKPDETVLAAFGDSYMSGEGAPEFYLGTNVKDRNECRRAPTAHAPVVVRRAVDAKSSTVPQNLAFVACSGAEGIHIHTNFQHPGDPIGSPEGKTQLEHLNFLIEGKGVKVAAVIVSIGGNEALFGEIGLACIGPGDCSELGGRWLANLKDRVAPEVAKTYREIRAHVAEHIGGQVPLLAVPYPVPLNDRGCPESLLSPAEHRFIHGFVVELNGVVQRAAERAGLYYLDEMPRVLENWNLRICDVPMGEAGVNFFGLNPVDGVLDQRVNPQHWLHNSLHPNARGHQVMSYALETWLEQAPVKLRAPASEPPARGERPGDVRPVGRVMGTVPICPASATAPGPERCRTVGDWIADQAAALLRQSIAPLLLVAGGAWALSLWFILWWRRHVGDRLWDWFVDRFGLPADHV